MLATASPAAAQTRGLFSIDSFVTSLVVNADGSLIVREDITFEFRGTHQGIFRRIPLRSTHDGLEFPLSLSGIGVYDEASRPLRTEVSYPDRSVMIKAWVPGAVDTKKTVTVVYHVRRGILAYEDHDELYWNATGNEWNAPIRNAEVYVTVPPGVGDAEVRTVAYTGALGAVGQDYAVDRVQSYWRFRTTRALRPREGVTVVVGWPPGRVAHPSELRRTLWLVADYWPLALPALALVWGGVVWWAFGRDPASNRSVKPEYAPPADLIPAEAGALVDERAHPRDVIATVVDLAVRGYLVIEPITTAFGEADFMFKRLKPVGGDPDLKDFELYVLAKIFGADWAINMRLLSEVRRDYENVFPPIRDRLYRLMVQDGLFPASPGSVRAGWMLAGVVTAIAGIVLPTFAPSWLGRYEPWLRIGVVVSGLVFIGWGWVMPRKTWSGVQILARVRGFQEFLERAEKDRLERMPPDTLHRWLPWAIALGVTERWIFNFQGLKVAAPAWYQSRGDFSLPSFVHDLGAFTRRTEEAILTTRRGYGDGRGSGGEGGGGFSSGTSGGGMGGGGGGTF
ncbi:MAG TPA: DUF2207 domain-containing protein [Candidatus Binatia bacterium]|nr:DUF2207 domain-containing protein [Candidatus Binatia bacterium]